MMLSSERGEVMKTTVRAVRNVDIDMSQPERAFAERTSAAIIVLLVFLMLMNSLAVILRQRFEQRW
jgi:ABC-type phosphate transport system permease subunit